MTCKTSCMIVYDYSAENVSATLHLRLKVAQGIPLVCVLRSALQSSHAAANSQAADKALSLSLFSSFFFLNLAEVKLALQKRQAEGVLLYCIYTSIFCAFLLKLILAMILEKAFPLKQKMDPLTKLH